MAYSQLAGLRAHQKSARHRPYAAAMMAAERKFKSSQASQRFITKNIYDQ